MRRSLVYMLIVIFIQIGWVFGTESYKADKDQGSAESAIAPSSVFNGTRDYKLIALTYDDGPNSRFTPRLLSLLREQNVPATFFLLGEQVKLYPNEARQIVEMGFEVGNHSFDHSNLSKMNEQGIDEQLQSTQEIIKKTAGIEPGVFRAPYGALSTTVKRLAHEKGLDIIMWSLDTEDWKTGSMKEQIVQTVLEKVKPGDIILMHDRNTRTIEATAELIPRLREEGYEFVTVSMLLRAKEYMPLVMEIRKSRLSRALAFAPIFLR